jgi:hypothetical protein
MTGIEKTSSKFFITGSGYYTDFFSSIDQTSPFSFKDKNLDKEIWDSAFKIIDTINFLKGDLTPHFTLSDFYTGKISKYMKHDFYTYIFFHGRNFYSPREKSKFKSISVDDFSNITYTLMKFIYFPSLPNYDFISVKLHQGFIKYR